jgi:hypothetical protein
MEHIERGSTYRLVWDNLDHYVRSALLNQLPWLPESVVIFNIKWGHGLSEWTDEVEDFSEDRTFPFRVSPVVYERLSIAPPPHGYNPGAFAFRNDNDAIRFILSIDS